ncbi:MAG: hypothetical protein AVDCRST_MAG88-3372, partial [uncultured Thermomicrobiales bacterium]
RRTCRAHRHRRRDSGARPAHPGSDRRGPLQPVPLRALVPARRRAVRRGGLVPHARESRGRRPPGV